MQERLTAKELEQLKEKGCDALWLSAEASKNISKEWLKASAAAQIAWVQEIGALGKGSSVSLSEESLTKNIHPQAHALAVHINQYRWQEENTQRQFKKLLEYFHNNHNGNNQSAKQGLIVNISIDPQDLGVLRLSWAKCLEYLKFFEEVHALLSQQERPNNFGLSLSIANSEQASILTLYRLLATVNQGLFPLILKGSYADIEEGIYSASVHLAPLLLDGLGDAIVLDFAKKETTIEQLKLYLEFHLDLLQATRLRLSKTEYISCPSCGRTLFDLEETTKRIQKHTAPSKGHQDRGYGFVLSMGQGKWLTLTLVTWELDQGKSICTVKKSWVKANVPAEQADQELLKLIEAIQAN